MVNVFIRDGGAERTQNRLWCTAWMLDLLACRYRSQHGKYADRGNWQAQLDAAPERFPQLELKARHYDPKARNWLARSINEETGTIKIAANANSPELCKPASSC